MKLWRVMPAENSGDARLDQNSVFSSDIRYPISRYLISESGKILRIFPGVST